MQRREILKTALSIPLAGMIAVGESCVAQESSQHTGGVARSRVRPADPKWPSPAEWTRLKEQVSGNLIEPHSPFESCESGPDAADCLAALNNIRNPFWVGEQPGGTET